jgi:hypothetical protein
VTDGTADAIGVHAVAAVFDGRLDAIANKSTLTNAFSDWCSTVTTSANEQLRSSKADVMWAA